MVTSKIKQRINKMALGLGLTAVVGSGVSSYNSYKEKQNNEKINKEWVTEHADADSIVADADNAHFYAEKKHSYADSYFEAIPKIRDRILELEGAMPALQRKEAKLNNELYKAAKDKDVKKYTVIKNKMLKERAFIDYDKEDEKGVSLKDLLEVNANSKDVHWTVIKRQKEQAVPTGAVASANSSSCAILKDNKDGSFKVMDYGVYQEKERVANRFNCPNGGCLVTLDDVLKSEVPSNVYDLDAQIMLARGFWNLQFLRENAYFRKVSPIETNGKYVVEKNGDKVKKELLRKATERASR